jgi:tetratricopeptide (TPR) repeat protein
MLVVILVVFIGLIFVFIGIFLRSSKSEKKYDQAIEFFDAEKYKEALELFQELLAKDSINKLYNWYIGQCYENLQNYELAIVEYNKVALSTKFPPPINETEIHEKLAMMNLKIGNVKKAYQEFQIVTTLSPNNAEAFYYLGVLTKNNDDMQKSLEYFDRAIMSSDNFPEAYLEHGKLNYHLKHIDKAKRSFVRAIEQNPDMPEAHYYYGMILEKDRIYQKGIREFRLALEDNRFRFDSYVHLGNIYWALEQKEESFKNFEKALELGKGKGEALVEAKYQYADRLVQAGDLNKAISMWNEIYNVSPKYKDVENRLQVYGEISKSENLTKFITSLKNDFLTAGNAICKLLKLNIEKYQFKKDDFLEFVGNQRAGGGELLCVLFLTRWTTQVGELPLRELLDRMAEEGATKGIFVTSAHFLEKAQDLSKIRPLTLLDREELEKLLAKIYD